jgi:hypothetical protein
MHFQQGKAINYWMREDANLATKFVLQIYSFVREAFTIKV